MSVVAKLHYLRIAPRKVRMVADLIRGKRVEESKVQLQFLTQKSARPLLKLLNSAAASARNDFKLDESNLYISKILINEGPKLKRWRARARGQAYEIQKKTSHITIVLDEIKETPKRIRSKRKTKKAIVAPQEKIVEEKERKPSTRQPKFRTEAEIKKPQIDKGIRRIFRRKAF